MDPREAPNVLDDEMLTVADQGGDDDEGEEVQVLVIGEEEAPQQAPEESSVIKRLRQELADSKRREAANRVEPNLPDPGPEPTIESCGYDEDEFRDKLRKWDRDTAAVATAKEQADTAQTKELESWQGELISYREKRARLPWEDVDAVEAAALAVLAGPQQAVILRAAADPAKLLYALGKFPAKLEEIAAIKDPIKLAYALASLEKGIAVMPKRRGIAPEEIASGTASTGGRGDPARERLEKQAQETGDRSAVQAYDREKKRKSAA